MGQKRLGIILGIYMLTLIIAGLFWPDSGHLWSAYKQIVTSPGVLVTDFFVVGSISVALINAGVVGLIGLFLIVITKTTISGPTIAAVFTLAGFAMFGKTPVNIWPVMLGVAVAAWIKREKFRTYIVVALFGTALGPVVSEIAFGLGIGYGVGALIGVAVGIFLPSLASHVLHNHQGFNLYNVGFTCGIMGMFVAAHLKMGGFLPEADFIWGNADQPLLAVFFFLFFLSFLALGWRGVKELPKLWKLPGTLVTDFISEQGSDPTLLNMGLVGLIGLSYVLLVGGDLNGPSIGGILTMVGFAAFGKHVANIWPVMLGVFLATKLSVWEVSEPGPLLAALFGTTLAPIAGGFGPVFGIIAGMIHLSVVMHVGVFHLGMNLYNNGFAGGLVGTLIIGASRWFGLGASRN